MLFVFVLDALNSGSTALYARGSRTQDLFCIQRVGFKNSRYKKPRRVIFCVLFSPVYNTHALQEQGRTFPTLQDELKSDFLAAATSYFAKLYRREVVVRDLLNRGDSDTSVCSTFKVYQTKKEIASAHIS